MVLTLTIFPICFKCYLTNAITESENTHWKTFCVCPVVLSLQSYAPLNIVTLLQFCTRSYCGGQSVYEPSHLVRLYFPRNFSRLTVVYPTCHVIDNWNTILNYALPCALFYNATCTHVILSQITQVYFNKCN